VYLQTDKENLLKILQISNTDTEIIRAMRTLGVLEEIDGHQLSEVSEAGTILVTCSDGDHFHDVFHHHCHHSASTRHHPLAAAGGPIAGLLSRDSNLLDEVRTAVEAKQITTVALTAHVPCAKAYGAEMTMRDVMAALLEKKELIRQHFPRMTIRMFCHVSNGTKRTYFVNKAKLTRFLEEQTVAA
jgi:hypothetical protein